MLVINYVGDLKKVYTGQQSCGLKEKNYNKTIVGDVAGMKLKTVYSKASILSRITNTLGEG